jgi:hypothetical protein
LNLHWEIDCGGSSRLSTVPLKGISCSPATASRLALLRKYVVSLVLKHPVLFMNCVLIKCHIRKRMVVLCHSWILKILRGVVCGDQICKARLAFPIAKLSNYGLRALQGPA